MATKLKFSVPPENQIRSVAPFPIEVVAVDDTDNIDISFSGTGTLTLESTTGAVLSGTTEVSFSRGIARVGDLSIDVPGTEYVLRVLNNTLAADTSHPFEVKGQPRWVDSALGNDANAPCSDPLLPCASVSTAVSAAACWDTILLHGDNAHPGPVTVIRRSCPPGEELIIGPWPDTGTPEILSTSGYALRVTDSNYVTVEGLRLTSQTFNGLEVTRVLGGVIRNCVVENAGGAGIVVNDSTDVLLEGNIIGNNSLRQLSVAGTSGFLTIIGNHISSGEVLFSGEQTATVSFARNRLTSSSIQVRDADTVFQNNIFDNSSLCFRIRASNILIENNTFHGSSNGCILLDAAGSGNIIRNNIFSTITGYGIQDIADNEPEVSYNAFFANTNGACNGLDTGKCDHGANGNLRGIDPLFVDTSNFYLQSTAGHYPFSTTDLDANDSPMLDAGNPASPFVNEPNANGGRVNLGAWGNTSRASRSP